MTSNRPNRPAGRHRSGVGHCLGLSLVAAALLAAAPVQAKTIRIADQGDALSMDPHSLNESAQLSFLQNVYEPLVARDRKLGVVPGLATAWTQQSDTVWIFKIRDGVTFHDGEKLSADDVVFSLERSRADGSDMKSYTAQVTTIRKTDDLTVEITTSTPFPILPDVLTQVMIMSKAWATENKSERPVDKRKGVENAASVRANGTGPFRLKSREPGVRTVLNRNARYWGKIDGNVTEVQFTPIGNDATRVAALISGQIDMMQPVPIQDVARLSRDSNLKIVQGPELRTIFLGMDQARDELLFSSVKGKNPFKDARVRQAFYQAIDIEAIKKRIMRDAANPLALMVAPGINGFDEALNKRPPFDPEASKRLLSEAGYADGFEVSMNCPNDRYVNDGEICQAVTSMLAKVGIRIRLEAESKSSYFPKILSRNTSFYMLGWTPSTYDAHNALINLMASPGPGGQGLFNLGSYNNARVDALTKQVGAEGDRARRQQLISEAFRIHKDEFGHIPLHQQFIAWGMRKNVTVVQLADNYNYYKWIQVD